MQKLSNFCYNFVIDEMKKTYSEEEVAKIINAATKKPTVAALSEVATVNVLPDSSEVNLFVECKEEKAAYIGTNVYYSIPVETGHMLPSGKFVPPKPYIKPAIENHVDEYKAIVKKYLSK